MWLMAAAPTLKRSQLNRLLGNSIDAQSQEELAQAFFSANFLFWIDPKLIRLGGAVKPLRAALLSIRCRKRQSAAAQTALRY